MISGLTVGVPSDSKANSLFLWYLEYHAFILVIFLPRRIRIFMNLYLRCCVIAIVMVNLYGKEQKAHT